MQNFKMASRVSTCPANWAIIVSKSMFSFPVIESRMSVDDFSEFIRRIRAGDQQAADELVRNYEPIIRREVRLHLEDQRLNRMLDSVDVSQSVLASFFLRATAGEYNLDEPAQLGRLLMQMARNKLASKSRWQFRASASSIALRCRRTSSHRPLQWIRPPARRFRPRN